jgi:hypothetical protein
MQRLGVARAHPGGGGVVYDNVRPTGLQQSTDSPIEMGRRRALGLDQRGVEIMVKQVQPQDIRWWHDLRYRHKVRRDGFDVLSARLRRKRPHAADRIVLEVGDFGRHEAKNLSFGSHHVGEQARPVAFARVNVDHGGARADAREPDQLGWFGLVGHWDLHYGWGFDERAAYDAAIHGSFTVDPELFAPKPWT